MLECEDEMLNTTDTISITDKKKKTCKNYFLIYIILLTTVGLILPDIVFISCYYYSTRYW